LPIAGSVATSSGLRLTAESLTGRRNRIGTVLVQRIASGASEPAASASSAEPGPGEPGGATANGTTTAGNGVVGSKNSPR